MAAALKYCSPWIVFLNWFGFSSHASWSSISCAYLTSYRRLAKGDGGWGELFKIGVGEGYSSNEWLNLIKISLELLGDTSVSKSVRSIPFLVHIAHEWMKIFQLYIHFEWTIIPPYIRTLCNWNTIEGIDLIHSASHLWTRSRIDGIKAMSRGFSGGKQVTKFSSTSNHSWVCLFCQNETTISWSCKIYVSSFGKI